MITFVTINHTRLRKCWFCFNAYMDFIIKFAMVDTIGKYGIPYHMVVGTLGINCLKYVMKLCVFCKFVVVARMLK